MNKIKSYVFYLFCLSALFLSSSAAAFASGDSILLHARKGIIRDGQIISFQIKSLFQELGCKIGTIAKIKEYQLKDDGGDDIEVFLVEFAEPPVNMQNLCDALDEQIGIVRVIKVESFSKEYSFPESMKE
jgi:hypothetical protein